MKYSISLALVALSLLYQPNALSHGVGPTGANVLDWHTEDISRVVSSEVTWSNLGVGRVVSPPGRVIEIEGMQCLQGEQFECAVRGSILISLRAM